MPVRLVLVLVLLCPRAPTALAGDPPLLRPGESIEGVIEDGDAAIETPALVAGGYMAAGPVVAKAFRVEVDRAGIHHLDLRGHGFDAYLVVRDPQGEVIAEDDDGLVATHARVVVPLEPGGAYRVEAAALHGRRGGFELRLRAGEPDEDEDLDWTDDEIRARIEQVFPEDRWKKVEVVKSKRYLVLTDSSAGKKFGKILDKDIFEGFCELYDVEPPKLKRRLCVYLFATRDGYIDFLVRTFRYERSQAEKSGGIAYQDYYTTSYTSPRDPTHFHECAHQIMGNVLKLNGGGSWFQEGVAEYYEDKVRKFNRQAETRMMIRTDQTVALIDLFKAPSML